MNLICKPKSTLFLLLALSILTSCSKVLIPQGQVLYKSQYSTPVIGAVVDVQAEKVKTPFFAKITDNMTYVEITPQGTIASYLTHVGDVSLIDATTPVAGKEITNGAQINLLQSIGNKLYFTDNLSETKFTPTGTTPYFLHKKLTYFDIKPVFQTLTIPIKSRPQRITGTDTALATVSTGVNVGFAGGAKFTMNVMSSKKSLLFNTNTTKISFIPGVFLGLGGTDLKAETTFPDVPKTRTALMINTGGYLMVGINSINFGYAFGADFATGQYSKQWIYNKQLWHGFIIAIDLIK